jgi:hypothetical protein
MRLIVHRYVNIFAMSRHREHQYVRFSLSLVNYGCSPIETIGIKFKVPRHLSGLDLSAKKFQANPCIHIRDERCWTDGHGRS